MNTGGERVRRLYLHIGLGKTGSSALQSWLSINAAELARQGIAYADLSADARAGRASSGNGVPLVEALRESDFSTVRRLLTEVYFPSGDASTALISSELLKDVRPPKLRQLHTLFTELDIEPHIVAYVRSVYERAYSTYGQRVKNAGATEPFSDGDIARSMLTTRAWLRKYQEQFGAAMTLLNYDAPDTDIYRALARVVGIDTTNMQAVDRQVNRSLSYRELEVQRQLNALHGGAFSAPIASHLINTNPDKRTAVHYDPALLKLTREVCAESVGWINEHFSPEPPLVCDRFETRTGAAPEEASADILRTVAAWAVSYEPGAGLAARYREFLGALLRLCGDDLSRDTREALAGRAQTES